MLSDLLSALFRRSLWSHPNCSPLKSPACFDCYRSIGREGGSRQLLSLHGRYFYSRLSTSVLQEHRRVDRFIPIHRLIFSPIIKRPSFILLAAHFYVFAAGEHSSQRKSSGHAVATVSRVSFLFTLIRLSSYPPFPTLNTQQRCQLVQIQGRGEWRGRRVPEAN